MKKELFLQMDIHMQKNEFKALILYPIKNSPKMIIDLNVKARTSKNNKSL